MKINICIPTYNRKSYLNRLLEAIAVAGGLDNPSFSITIFDNASTERVDSYILDERITIFRNSYNVGAVGNVLKCIESVQSGWVWIIGDDDLIDFECLRNAEKVCNENQNSAAIFCSNKFSPIDFACVTRSQEEFAARLSRRSFGARLWTSSHLLNSRYTSTVLKNCFYYPASSPHLTWALMNSDQPISFVPENIALHNMADGENHWHPETVISGLLQSLTMPIRPALLNALGSILSSWILDFPQSVAKLVSHEIKNNDEYGHYEMSVLMRFVMANTAQRKFGDAVEVMKVISQLRSDSYLAQLRQKLRELPIPNPSRKTFSTAL
jgi:glycosyltransferase involved in cell wall biosynthesis